MKSAIRPFRAQSRPICQLCDQTLQQPAFRRTFLTASTLKTPSMRSQAARKNGAFTAMQQKRGFLLRESKIQEPEIERPSLNDNIPIDQQLKQTEKHIKHICDSPKVLPESDTYQALTELDHIARRAISLRGKGQSNKVKLNLRKSSAESILSLNNETPAPKKAPATKEKDIPTPSYISKLAEDLVSHPNVFISPTILNAYVDLQRLLQRPRAIPPVFVLYANKPIPQLGSEPPVYRQPKNWGPKQAIPSYIADKALDAAIAAKDMPGALAVVDTTWCAPAFRTHKLLSKVLPPFAAACATPFALYELATQIGEYHGYLEPDKFKYYCFMGMMTYVFCTGSLGYVAFTTSTTCERINWKPGTRLTERWVREEERAALDKIASAWGFKEAWKRGDEEGEEWAGLRTWCFLRGMWLDKPDLLPGMNPPLSSEI